MSKINLVFVGVVLIAVSISCKSLMPTKTAETGSEPPVDFTTPGRSLDVKVQLDKKLTASDKISSAGGTLSLTGADGSQFTLEIPPNALDADTAITMTAVKTLDGAPVDTNTPAAVQLEPSGLIFKDFVTLTIVPGKEIPVEQQVIFGYEGDGKDYHLALVDPKSKEIKIKLLGFSGAGVSMSSGRGWGSGMQVASAKTRLIQKFAEATQEERRAVERGETPKSTKELLKPFLDAFYEQVVKVKIEAGERDCQHAKQALEDLHFHERMLQLAGLADSATGSPGFTETVKHLLEIGNRCARPYQVVGGLDDWQTNTKVCDIMKPFTLTGGGFTMEFSGGMSGTYSYTGPFNANGTGSYSISLPDGPGKPGTMTGGGEGQVTGDKVYTGSGVEKYTLTPIPPCS